MGVLNDKKITSHSRIPGRGSQKETFKRENKISPNSNTKQRPKNQPYQRKN